MKANGTGPLQHHKVGVREVQDVVHTNRSIHGSCCDGRLFARKNEQVESMRLGSSAVGS